MDKEELGSGRGSIIENLFRTHHFQRRRQHLGRFGPESYFDGFPIYAARLGFPFVISKRNSRCKTQELGLGLGLV